MSQYLVTGCIVTFNNAKIIRHALDTLFEYTKGVNFKLYVVDNMSVDGTTDIIANEYKQVELIKTGQNVGFGAGHNKVLDRLDSKYHIFINPDITIREDIISKMADYLDNNSDIGLVSPRICFPNGNDQILGKRNPKLKYLISSRLRWKPLQGCLDEYAMLDEDQGNIFDIENASGCFMMVRTDLLKKIGGFDPNYFMYFEDCDLTRTVRQTGRAVHYGKVVVYHEWGRESKKNFRLMIIQIKSMLYYFRKWRRLKGKCEYGTVDTNKVEN